MTTPVMVANLNFLHAFAHSLAAAAKQTAEATLYACSEGRKNG
jgi:hypothetical protein